jgi:hypothetical protein
MGRAANSEKPAIGSYHLLTVPVVVGKSHGRTASTRCSIPAKGRRECKSLVICSLRVDCKQVDRSIG